MAGRIELSEKDVVDPWHWPQSPVAGCGAPGRVTIVTPKNVFPVSWQVAHGIEATAA